MAVKKITNNAIGWLKILPVPEVLSQLADSDKLLIDDLRNNGLIWQRSQTDPVVFSGTTEKIIAKDILFRDKFGYGIALFRNCFFEATEDHSEEQIHLLVLECAERERSKFEWLKARFDPSLANNPEYSRDRIPEEVRIAVWRRDQGKCVKCGSRRNLEYDHIIPVSLGGSNTIRNIELLCEHCNRSKQDTIQ